MVMRLRAVANTSSLVVGNNHLVGGISSFDGEMDIYFSFANRHQASGKTSFGGWEIF